MMKGKLFLRATALVAMAAFVMPFVPPFVPHATAYVTTDQLDYAPGSTVTISGDNRDDAGYLPDETVIVDVNGPNGYVSSCEAIAGPEGAWSCQVLLLPTDLAVGTYVYTATGQSSGVAESGFFTDATLTFFEDAALTIQRNAFAWGETIHARGTALTVGRCARIQWKNPSNAVVQEDQVVAVGGTMTASFTVPATGPSGTWSATLQSSGSATCPPPASPGFTTVGQSTQVFDVARKVIVGAGSPSTVTADDPGGDNFVAQSVPSTVQGSLGLGNSLNVVPRTNLSQRTFLRFDVAGAGIPAFATITDAKLRLRVTKTPTVSCGATLPRQYDLQPATSSWSEGSITWNSQLAIGVTGTASSLSISTVLPADSYVRFGVTDHVQDFVDGSLTNHGWRLKDNSETAGTTNCDSSFASTEANETQKSVWPVLLIDYESAPPPLVTNGSLCTFDVNPDRDGSQFRLIFTPDQPSSTPADPRWKLNASNPGQIFFNAFATGTPGATETVTLTLPYPFVTQGANPIHVFDGVTVVENGQTCLTPGDPVTLITDPPTVALSDYTGSTIDVDVTFEIPSGGLAHIVVHLNYGLKHVSSKCKPDNKIDLNVTCDLPSSVDIDNHAPYTFSFSNGSSGSATVENENVVKNDPGIAGLVTNTAGDPLAGAKVEIYNSSGGKLATVYSDSDGWYQWTYKHTGKAAAFVVKLPEYYLQQTVTLKSNAYVIVNFTAP